MVFLGHDNPSVTVTFLFWLRGMLRRDILYHLNGWSGSKWVHNAVLNESLFYVQYNA